MKEKRIIGFEPTYDLLKKDELFYRQNVYTLQHKITPDLQYLKEYKKQIHTVLRYQKFISWDYFICYSNNFVLFFTKVLLTFSLDYIFNIQIQLLEFNILP